MQLHQLKPIHSQKKRNRIGRGGKKGTYSGKGMKGQKSRAGHRMQPIIRELIKKYPKLRGYRFGSTYRNKKKILNLNLDILEKHFEAGEKVSPEMLLEKKIASKIKGRMPKIKILAKGKLTKALNFEGCQFSKKAEDIIKKAGGKIKS